MLQLAVIKTGGKQYIVSPGKKLKIEKLDVPEGGKVVFDQVLLVGDGDNVEIGKPLVLNVKVEGKVLTQGRARKVIVFKYHRKTRYRKKKGHRQHFTEIEITKITL
ncbi:MAG: 50S ribosomal protein L21 [Parcubacteria group bacterium GW2011_GWA2_45_30]|nr:MAG: 50S ribosomal protein L21 [Parcubacteria group bacterium GW2011_GWA2_45_30]